jgi:sarcosine oxidase subunit gamma
LGHARCRIRISGGKCRDTLSKLFAIDLRDAAFPVSQARLTGHHHVPALLHRVGPDQFDIYVFTTYAQDQLHALVDAALEYGVALTG